MSDTERLTEDVFDALAEGRTPSAAAGSPVAKFLRSLRDDATTSAAPTPELAAVLSEGLDPKELEAGGILTAETDQGILTRGILTAETDRGILTRGILTFSGSRAASPKGILTRSRLATRAAFTNMAAFGILTKAAAAGAAVTVATAGAGTANVLPNGAQMAFDDIVGREPVVEVEEEVEDPIGEIVVETDDNEANDFGERVSGDATGETDGEKGVDGREIACERASENSNACEDEDVDESRGRGVGADDADDADDAEDEREEAEERVEDEREKAEERVEDEREKAEGDDADQLDDEDDEDDVKSEGDGADKKDARGNGNRSGD